jgi:hypothetical protein
VTQAGVEAAAVEQRQDRRQRQPQLVELAVGVLHRVEEVLLVDHAHRQEVVVLVVEHHQIRLQRGADVLQPDAGLPEGVGAHPGAVGGGLARGEHPGGARGLRRLHRVVAQPQRVGGDVYAVGLDLHHARPQPPEQQRVVLKQRVRLVDVQRLGGPDHPRGQLCGQPDAQRGGGAEGQLFEESAHRRCTV